MKISGILLCVCFCVFLAGCVTSVDDRLPYAQLPQITVAYPVFLVASSSHPTAYLASEPVQAGEQVLVIGTDPDAAWLLVLHDGMLGWMQAILSRTNIGTLKPAIKVKPLPSTCTRYLGATFGPDEDWVSDIGGSVIVLGSIYRPQAGKRFQDSSLTIDVDGRRTAVAADYVHTLLTPSNAVVLFAVAVDDLHRGSRIGFDLANPSNERVSFQAAFFGNDCSDSLNLAEVEIVDRLPIGETKVVANQVSTSDQSPPQPLPTVVITITRGPPRPASGVITAAVLNVRSGPGVEYQPPIAKLKVGDNVSIVGYNTATDGSTWWQIRTSSGQSGWVHSEYVQESGCIECVSRVSKPRIPPTPTPTPRPIASNKGDLTQGQNGWTYQYEQGRGSGVFIALSNRRSYNGIDCYMSPREDFVRLCRDGELHPGQQGRIAYRWDSHHNGPVTIRVDAHKVDTRGGDGIWVGTYTGKQGQPPQQLGTFEIGGADNRGKTRQYSTNLSSNSYVLVMIDIRRTAEYDQSRVFIDIF